MKAKPKKSATTPQLVRRTYDHVLALRHQLDAISETLRIEREGRATRETAATKLIEISRHLIKQNDSLRAENTNLREEAQVRTYVGSANEFLAKPLPDYVRDLPTPALGTLPAARGGVALATHDFSKDPKRCGNCGYHVEALLASGEGCAGKAA